jgi:hypothetical protein
VLAVAKLLMVHRFFDASMIDAIIASAPGRVRRADWAKVFGNAADFDAGMESYVRT